MPSTVTHCHALSRRVLRCFAHDRLTLIRICGSRQRKLRWRTTCLDQLCLRWTEAGRADRICMDLRCAPTGPLGSAHWGVVCGDKSRSWPRAVGCGCPVIQQGTASPSNKTPHAALCSLRDANLDPSMNLPIPHFALLRIASHRVASLRATG